MKHKHEHKFRNLGLYCSKLSHDIDNTGYNCDVFNLENEVCSWRGSLFEEMTLCINKHWFWPLIGGILKKSKFYKKWEQNGTRNTTHADFVFRFSQNIKEVFLLVSFDPFFFRLVAFLALEVKSKETKDDEIHQIMILDFVSRR